MYTQEESAILNHVLLKCQKIMNNNKQINNKRNQYQINDIEEGMLTRPPPSIFRVFPPPFLPPPAVAPRVPAHGGRAQFGDFRGSHAAGGAGDQCAHSKGKEGGKVPGSCWQEKNALWVRRQEAGIRFSHRIPPQKVKSGHHFRIIFKKNEGK